MDTKELLAVAAGGLLSLLFSYFPFVKDWYDAQEPIRKAQVMLLALVVVAGLLFADGCFPQVNVFPASVIVACTTQGGANLLMLVVLAAVGNQTTFGFTQSLRRQPSEVRRERALAKGYKQL
jgi:hypothetical protein